MEKIIYTLGTSNRTLTEFLRILKKYKIELVCDVRRFPTSKFEYFKKDSLKKSLKEHNIDYLWLGDILGGFRKPNYQEYTKTKDFKKGIEKIKSLGKSKKLCIICSERLYFKCHRNFIAKALSNEFEVIHIIEEDKIASVKRS